MKEYIDKQLDECERAVGPLFACQLSVKMFISDLHKNMERISYAVDVYKWLGQIECTVDELFQISYDKSVFILEVLEKYPIVSGDFNVLLNYDYAIHSLEYQKSFVTFV